LGFYRYSLRWLIDNGWEHRKHENVDAMVSAFKCVHNVCIFLTSNLPFWIIHFRVLGLLINLLNFFDLSGWMATVIIMYYSFYLEHFWSLAVGVTVIVGLSHKDAIFQCYISISCVDPEWKEYPKWLDFCPLQFCCLCHPYSFI